MKSTGNIRRIDDLGRIVIPKNIRHTLNIKEADQFEIFTHNDNTIVLRKYHDEDSELDSEDFKTMCFENLKKSLDKAKQK